MRSAVTVPPGRLRYGLLSRTLAVPLILGVRAYQMTLRHAMGGQCRFQPTCSEYAIGALETHGAFRGTWLATRRLLRCHPFGGFGYDPVPPGGDS